MKMMSNGRMTAAWFSGTAIPGGGVPSPYSPYSPTTAGNVPPWPDAVGPFPSKK